MTLRDWAVRPGSDNAFLAPELGGIRLSGLAYGHPRFAAGHAVTTSQVIAVDGRRVTTESGRVYLLEGEPEAAYLAWLAEQGRAYNAERPIAVVSRSA